MTPETIAIAEAALIRADPLLGSVIQAQTLILQPERSGYFASLTRSIIGQQVSVAAARAIAARFEDATAMQPAAVLLLSDDDVRAIGLSKQKASYIHDLAAHFAKNPAIYTHLDTLSDDEIILELTAVKGIGVWTAQMFMMFTLGRPDVFAPDDVGLQRAMMRLYSWESLPPKKELVQAAELWQPYRTVASFHLWQSLTATPA